MSAEPIGNETSPVKVERRPYSPPAILSREPLEAIAAACSPPTGKTNPVLCPMGLRS